MQISDDKKIEILNDYRKDTSSELQFREKACNHLFLISIAVVV